MSLFEDFLLLVDALSANFFAERLALGAVSLNELVERAVLVVFL